MRDGRWKPGAEGWKLRPRFRGDGNGFGESLGCLCSSTLQPSQLDQGTCSSRRNHSGVMLGSRLQGASQQRHHPASELSSPTSSTFLCWTPLGLEAFALPSSLHQVPGLASPLQPSASEPPAQIYCHTLKPGLSARVTVSQRPLIDLFYLPLAKKHFGPSPLDAVRGFPRPSVLPLPILVLHSRTLWAWGSGRPAEPLIS